MDNIRAVVYHAPGDLRKERIPLPPCGAREIRVKVDACAVCGTDLKAFLAGNPRILAPKVMGHEFTGRVETIGREAASDLELGDRIVMATSVACGTCYYCRRQRNNLCADLKPMGFAYDGGMAEYVILPERALANGHVITVPAHVPALHAALAEPLSCAINALENCALDPGDTVVIIGAGPMGIMNGCVAREFGAGQIILAEVNPDRLQQGEKFGFDRRVNPATEDLAQVVKDLTGGIGADVVIVAAPAAAPQEQALALVRKRGTVCLFASLLAGQSLLSLDSRLIHYGELRLVGTSDSTPAHVRKAVDLLARGAFPAADLVTHVLDLFDFEKALGLMRHGECLRVVLVP